MEKKYLIVNSGSTSKKYAFYLGKSEVVNIHLETEGAGILSTVKINSRERKEKLSKENYDSSIDYLIKILLQENLIKDEKEIHAIGMRIVAPGKYFISDRLVDGQYLKNLKIASKKAPLHIKPVISEIERLKKVLPKTPIIGISDSAFHASRPQESKIYALSEKLALRLEIYRYGYHGISAEAIVHKIKTEYKKIPRRIIICHLGSGASITAVKDGKSFETSMGFTPIEGLTMSTRIGNIDAAAVIYLAKNSGMSLDRLESYLNNECGLLGISGRTPDIRELLKLEKAGDPKARLALRAFVWQVQKCIGSYTAIMGGLDWLVFTATIGERSFVMRSRICKNLASLGIVLDENKNKTFVSKNGFISRDTSGVKIAVATLDEMKEMAKKTMTIT